MSALKTTRARLARAALGAAIIAAFASASATRASHASEEKKAPADSSELQQMEPMRMMGSGSFGAGERVQVKPGKEHDPAHAGVQGTIREVQGKTYGILFDGTNQVHRWYTADELAAAGRPE